MQAIIQIRWDAYIEKNNWIIFLILFPNSILALGEFALTIPVWWIIIPEYLKYECSLQKESGAYIVT